MSHDSYVRLFSLENKIFKDIFSIFLNYLWLCSVGLCCLKAFSIDGGFTAHDWIFGNHCFQFGEKDIVHFGVIFYG